MSLGRSLVDWAPTLESTPNGTCLWAWRTVMAAAGQKPDTAIGFEFLMAVATRSDSGGDWDAEDLLL